LRALLPDDGGSRGEAARIGGLQTVPDWVLAFNAEGPAGLVSGKAPGNAALNDTHRQVLLRRERPDPGGSRGGPLATWRSGCSRASAFRSASKRWSRELRAVGLRKLSARPRHHAPGCRHRGGVQKAYQSLGPPV
jgi:hypothetical protein